MTRPNTAGALDPLEPLPAEAPAKVAPSEADLMRVVEADFLKTGQPLKLKFSVPATTVTTC